MANQGWPNGSGDGVQTSSTARQSGRGTTNAETGFIKGSRIAVPGGGTDPLDAPDDLFEAPGQLSDWGPAEP